MRKHVKMMAIEKIAEKLRDEIKDIDDKRHVQNNNVNAILGKYDERIKDIEAINCSNASQLILHASTLLTLEKNDARIERVVENNTQASHAQAIAFTELSISVKTGIRIAIFIIPILSSLVAYIASLLVGR